MATVNVTFASFAFPREGTADLILTYDDVTMRIQGIGVLGAIANRAMRLKMKNRALAPPADEFDMLINPIITGRLDIPVLQRSDWLMVIDPDDGEAMTAPGIEIGASVVETRPRRKGATR
jgi:hypothetical protein